MKREDFIELLQKYNRGKASKEEQRFFRRYYHLFNAEPDVLSDLSERQKCALRKEIQNSIWKSISSEEQRKKNIRYRKNWKKKVSAALLLLILCTTGIAFYFLQPSELTTIVMKVEEGEENQLVRLPDGSTALIHAGSQLTVPSSFEGMQRREISLEGKAYFDVKRDSLKKFIIHTEDLKTIVLGTSFIIEAYPTQENISINVISGRVKVADRCQTFGVLTNGDELIYNKGMADIVQEPPEKVVEQDLLMDNVSLAEAIVLLEKQFKVSIDCKRKLLLEKHFTTTFRKEESLEQVLKSMCEFTDADFNYDKEKATVVIYSKNK